MLPFVHIVRYLNLNFGQVFSGTPGIIGYSFSLLSWSYLHAVIDMCWFLILLICTIELKFDPNKKNYCYNLSLYYWIPNCTADHNFSKFPLLKVYSIKHNSDIICLSEMYLDSSMQYDDKRLSKWIQTS